MIIESAIDWFERMMPPPRLSAPVAERQSGVIPYAIVEATPVFLLVTSRQRGHWIFPKGRIPDGIGARESALKEAYEEAGIEGAIAPQPIGAYRTWKTRGMRRFVIQVEMYPLLVHEQHENWRETGERHRHWTTLPEATRLITDKRLAGLVRKLARQLRAADHPRAKADMTA